MKLEWFTEGDELIIKESGSGLSSVRYKKKKGYLKLRSYLNDLSIVNDQVIGLCGLLQSRIGCLGEKDSTHLLRINFKSYLDIDENEECFNLAKSPRQYGVSLNQSVFLITVYMEWEKLKKLIALNLPDEGTKTYLAINLKTDNLKGIYTTGRDYPHELKLLDYETLNNLAQSDDAIYNFIDNAPNEADSFNEDELIYGDIRVVVGHLDL